MKNNTIYVSGLLNFETILSIDQFPVRYFPIDYPFYRVNSTVSGTAYNIAKALKTLGDNVNLSSHLGKDFLGKVCVNEIKREKIDVSNIKLDLDETPNSVVLVDRAGNTEVHYDLKDAQDVKTKFEEEKEKMEEADLLIIMNCEFNRPLLKQAKKLNKKILCDVHIVGSINDEFNADFMKYSDILFLSCKGLSDYNYEDFLLAIYNKFHNEIIVLGEGRDGAMILDSKKRIIYHIDSITLREIVNTVGSRDALLSAFSHYYLKGEDSLVALEKAEVFTSYKLGASGGSEGFLKEKEVEKYYKETDFDVYKIKEF